MLHNRLILKLAILIDFFFSSLCNQVHISPAMSSKFLQSSAHNLGRQSVSKGTEITIQQDGMTVRLVTISIKSSPTLILHEPVLMGESFYSLLPYLCSGYPRLASQELAFYHAFSGGWRNRCGIPWPLPACHALYSLAKSFRVNRWTLGGGAQSTCPCFVMVTWRISSRNLGLTLRLSEQSLQMKVLVMHGDGAFKDCTASLVWLPFLLIRDDISCEMIKTELIWHCPAIHTPFKPCQPLYRIT